MAKCPVCISDELHGLESDGFGVYLDKKMKYVSADLYVKLHPYNMAEDNTWLQLGGVNRDTYEDNFLDISKIDKTRVS